MGRSRDQRGIALIMLIGITATLAILALMIALALVNQDKATANQRSRQQSFDNANGALDHAVSMVKTEVTLPEDAASAGSLDVAAFRLKWSAFSHPAPHSMAFGSTTTAGTLPIAPGIGTQPGS